ncbi:MAG: hypothetical protein Q4615_11430 [Paracoccus aminovorans]|nr:hypothetical protein [Paracoccus aminovorans]
MPRAALAQATGLSAQAVTNITRELIADGLLDAGASGSAARSASRCCRWRWRRTGRCFWASRSGAGWPSWCWSISPARSGRCARCPMPFHSPMRSGTSRSRPVPSCWPG